MLKFVTSVGLCLFALSGGLALGKTRKKTTKPAAAHSNARRAAPAKSASRSKTGARSKTVAHRNTPSSKRGKSSTAVSANTRKPEPQKDRQNARPVVARRSTQQVPTPERYREIQQALADKGYYQGPVNGTWGADSASALQRFQKERNLSDTGKLDSLSLIALGLGPKRNLSARSTSETRPKDDNRRTEGSERP